MSAESTTTPHPETPAASGRGSRAYQLARASGVAVLVLLVLLGLLLVFPPIGLFKSRLATMAGDAIGRSVTIGNARLSLGSTSRLELDDVSIRSRDDPGGPEFLRVATVKLTFPLWPLVKGTLEIANLDLVQPTVSLVEEESGKRSWIRGPTDGDAPPALLLLLPRRASIADGRVSYASAKTGSEVAVEKVNARIATTHENGVFEMEGAFDFKGEGVLFGIVLADFRVVPEGKPADVRAGLISRDVRADIAGEVLTSPRIAITGDLKASTASIVDLARWLGASVASSGAPLEASLAGRVKATATDVLLAATEVVVHGGSSRIDGRLGLAGPRPKFEGTIAVDRLDLSRLAAPDAPPAAAASGKVVAIPAWDSLLADLEALESGQPKRIVQPDEVNVGPAPEPGWSERPIGFNALKLIDLDAIVSASEIAWAGLELKGGRVKAALADGRLDAKLEALEMGAGRATAAIGIDGRASPPRAELSLSMTGVAAEPIAKALFGAAILAGTANLEVAARASGESPRDLASTLDGKVKLHMGSGALGGFDMPSVLTAWWHNWSFDPARKTAFERLDADYEIESGVMKSAPALVLVGPEVEASSTGAIDLSRRRVDQEVRIKVASSPAARPVPVRISGAWSSPAIGIDWGKLLSGADGIGSPQAIAPPAEPPPLPVQAAIRRVLAADIDPRALSEEGRAMLRALLPEEQPASPPPSGNGVTQPGRS